MTTHPNTYSSSGLRSDELKQIFDCTRIPFLEMDPRRPGFFVDFYLREHADAIWYVIEPVLRIQGNDASRILVSLWKGRIHVEWATPEGLYECDIALEKLKEVSETID